MVGSERDEDEATRRAIYASLLFSPLVSVMSSRLNAMTSVYRVD